MTRTFALTALALACASCSALRPPPQDTLQHVVLLWLKDPGNAAHRQQIMAASETFRAIPSVLAVEVGEPIPSERAIVDDSFDVGILVEVRDTEALQQYLDHPIHTKARDEVLLPLVEKVLVYDFQP